MKKSGNKAFAKKLKILKKKGAWAVTSNGQPILPAAANITRNGFIVQRTARTLKFNDCHF